DEKVQAVVIGDSCFMAIYQKTDLQLENGITLHFEEPGTYIAGIAGGEVTVGAPFRQMKK
ncbi:MAG: hypothetical protein RR471_09845, partial [Bacteroides sp.]